MKRRGKFSLKLILEHYLQADVPNTSTGFRDCEDLSCIEICAHGPTDDTPNHSPNSNPDPNLIDNPNDGCSHWFSHHDWTGLVRGNRSRSCFEKVKKFEGFGAVSEALGGTSGVDLNNRLLLVITMTSCYW